MPLLNDPVHLETLYSNTLTIELSSNTCLWLFEMLWVKLITENINAVQLFETVYRSHGVLQASAVTRGSSTHSVGVDPVLVWKHLCFAVTHQVHLHSRTDSPGYTTHHDPHWYKPLLWLGKDFEMPFTTFQNISDYFKDKIVDVEFLFPVIFQLSRRWRHIVNYL